MTQRVFVMRAALLLGLSAAGCGWFEEPATACTAPDQRCDGDAIQICVPDVDNRKNGGVADVWKTVQTCEDDPVLGAFTCELQNGQPTCVREGADGGVDGAMEGPSSWLRLTVVRSSDAYRIEDLRERLLPSEGLPVGAAFGEVAAVAYQGDEPVDATLVRFADGVEYGSSRVSSIGAEGSSGPAQGVEQVIWLRASAATRVALIDEKGFELAQRVVQADSKGRVNHISQALEAEVPPTLRLFKAADADRIPIEVSSKMGPVVDPTPEMLSMFTQAYERAPWLASSAITGLGFTSRDMLEVEVDAGVAEQDGGVPAVPDQSAVSSPATGLIGNTLFINASRPWLEDFRGDPSHTVLRVIHEMASAYVYLSRAPKLGELRGPSDYPETFARLIQARVSRLLAPREGFEAAWSALQTTAVEAELAGPYSGADWASRDSAAATRDGFFSPLGGKDALSDFAETVALLHVPERWVDSPCTSLVAGLQDLPARSILPFAKVEVVRALGLLTDEVADGCRFVLGREDWPKGLAFYTPDGASLVFDEQLSATRQPYLRGQVHTTVIGSRGDTTAMIDLAYRGQGLGLHRLLASNARENPEEGAGVYLSRTTEYATTDSVGGILLVTELGENRVRVIGLFVKQRGEMFGTDMFPLVTADFEAPLWVE